MTANSRAYDFDVVIVGSGVAGALLAYRLSGAKLNVLLLEAGSSAPDRTTIQENFVTSPLKTADSPFLDSSVAPQPRAATVGRTYYVENDIPKPPPAPPPGSPKPPVDPNPVVPFISYYERLL